MISAEEAQLSTPQQTGVLRMGGLDREASRGTEIIQGTFGAASSFARR